VGFRPGTVRNSVYRQDSEYRPEFSTAPGLPPTASGLRPTVFPEFRIQPVYGIQEFHVIFTKPNSPRKISSFPPLPWWCDSRQTKAPMKSILFLSIMFLTAASTTREFGSGLMCDNGSGSTDSY